MTTHQIEIREYPLGEKVSIEELTSEGAQALMTECRRLLSDLEDVARGG